MSDPAEDVPTDRQFRESNRDFELGALRLGMTRAVGIRTVVELTDQLHRSIQGMEVAIPMIADVHHASTDRTVTVKDVEFQQSEIRVRRPSVSHFAYLRDHEPSVDSQNQLGCYVSKSWNSSRLADRCFFWPEVIHLRRRALPQPPGHVAGLAERPQNVAAENLVHVRLEITAAQQL